MKVNIWMDNVLWENKSKPLADYIIEKKKRISSS